MKPWDPNLLPRPIPGHGYHIRHWNPPRLLISSFVVLIAVGTGLLKTPWATHESISWLDAAFTATSAVTVTGLVVVDTGGDFTIFGQLIILMLIQLGGIGLMTFAVLMAAALGFRLGISQQLIAQQALMQPALSAIKKSALTISLFALAVECLGVALLAAFFVPEKGWGDGLYHSLFYAVSAFNNAGFALSPDSLSAYAGHWGINVTITGLFITGGLGFIVVMEVFNQRRWRRLSAYARLMLLATLYVNIIATAIFFAFEYANPDTLGRLSSWSDKLLAAWFQGTTPRTAGFNTLDVGQFTMATSVFFLLLMFVGGAPNSTASGIKLSTFIVLVAATRSFLTGNLSVRLGHHSVSTDVVIRALAITTIGMMTVFLAILGVSLVETAAFGDIAFEVVSAFGTVGLSRGITDDLAVSSQLILMLVMLIGRVGPLTLGYMLMMPKKQYVRYAYTEFPVG